MRYATATLASRIALGLRPNSIQKRVAFLKESRIDQRAHNKKDLSHSQYSTVLTSSRPRERLFALQKELRHALCLQADNGFASFTHSIYDKSQRSARSAKSVHYKRKR